ncbi:MAG: ABC transporter ATP-binding protein [Acidimicrobiales bacterium]
MTSRSTTTALTVSDASRRFGSVVAVDGVGLTLGSDELIALVGPSGCGKSTLLRAIAGLTPLDGGRIVLGDTTVDDGRHRVPPEHRSIGLVFQEHSLFPHLDVADNVGFGLSALGPRERRERVDAMLTLVELGGHGGRFPHELSGGERQRVALARALAPRPALVLLDEPFASLDPNLRVQLRAEVVGALRATGTPAIFVTHDQMEAMAIGDRIAVMRSGRIEQVDRPEVVFHAPANTFVAGFMGEASFLELDHDLDLGQDLDQAPATGGHGPVTVLGPVGSPPESTGPPSTVDDPVAMVRPDDVLFIPGDGAGVRGRITEAEFRGATWCYTVELADGTRVASSLSHLDPLTVGTVGVVTLTPGHRQILVPRAR